MNDFQNPQQEPGTERRLMLAFALTFLIVIGSQFLMKKYGPPVPAAVPVTQSATQTPSTQNASPQASGAPTPSSTAAATGGKGSSAPDLDIVINPKRAVLKAEFAAIAQEVHRAFETVLKKSAPSGASSAATQKSNNS